MRQDSEDMMRYFPQTVYFRKTWRSYQARVLDRLQDHLVDDRLHVVAPPGSGKTVLGLEIVRRLNRPTLILAPTLIIRDQWIERFVQLFLPEGADKPAWITTDLKKPGFLTVATYQAVHTAYAGERPSADTAGTANRVGGRDELIKKLSAVGIRTLVVDEAHHLRSAWWRSLVEVRDALVDLKVVALTATPPYDVTIAEWERYQEFCGPVDYEIAVPELVANGDLCPHQDYICFCPPSVEGTKILACRRASIDGFINDLKANTDLIRGVAAHPWLNDPLRNIDLIRNNLQYTLDMIAFLRHTGTKIPSLLLRLLGLSIRRLPVPDRACLERILTGCLFDDSANYRLYQGALSEIHRRLEQLGAIERQRVHLGGTAETEALYAASANKLQSVASIFRAEWNSLGRDLRLVVLTDYIRMAALPDAPGKDAPQVKIGVVPIFETIRRAHPGIKIGILSGSLVVIPESARRRAASLADQAGQRLPVRVLDHDPDYIRLDSDDSMNQGLVQLVTALFDMGEINVLVGTKSLLGEGWDAPAVNALILASCVGSYVTSNQMRGRAIRTSSGNPSKTANIWHLACVEPGEDPGPDYEALSRRFKAFVGVSFDAPAIENGIGRMALKSPPFSMEGIRLLNESAFSAAGDREKLRLRWDEALGSGRQTALVEQVEASGEQTPQAVVFTNTLRSLLIQGALAGANVYLFLLRGRLGTAVLQGTNLKELLDFSLATMILVFLGMMPQMAKAFWLFLRHGSIDSSLREVARVVLHTLIGLGKIKTPLEEMGLRVERGGKGEACFTLNGATTYESKIFLDALQEVLDPIEDPRFLLVRQAKPAFMSREDYHAVPTLIGRTYKGAKLFQKYWRKFVGPARIVYTRNRQGLRFLCRAKVRSFSGGFRRRSCRICRWI